MSTPLTGAELTAKVTEMIGEATEPEIAVACGYANAAGKANVNAFRQARLDALGAGITPPKRERRGRTPSFEAKVGPKGQIVLTGGYGALIGLEPGDYARIQHIGNSLVLCPAGEVPTFRDEPAPATRAATYDD
jgi:hypothetical protein